MQTKKEQEAQDLGAAHATNAQLQTNLSAEKTVNTQLRVDLSSSSHQISAVTKKLLLYENKLPAKDTALATLQQQLTVLVPLVQRMLEYLPALW